MKSEIYNALAAINRGFDMTLESFAVLQQAGVLDTAYVQQQTEITEEIRAGLNHMILDKMESREEDDWANFGKMRRDTEARLQTEKPATLIEVPRLKS